MSGDTNSKARRLDTGRLVELSTISVICCYVAWLTFIFRRWDTDAGYIVYRIVRNLIEHSAWSFNIGEKLNASASVLNTFLIYSLSKVSGSLEPDLSLRTPGIAHLIGGVSILIASLSFRRLFALNGHALIGTIAAMHLAAVLAYAGSWGTEVHLTAALLFLFMVVERTGYLFLGLAFISSFDTIFVALTKALKDFVGFLSRKLRRSSARFSPEGAPKRTGLIPGWVLSCAIPFFLPVVPWFVYSLFTFEQLFPDILAAKMWQGRSGYWGQGAIYWDALVAHLFAVPPIVWTYYCAAIVGLVYLLVRRHQLLYLLVFTAAQQCVFSFLNIPATSSHFVWIDISLLICSWSFAAAVMTKVEGFIKKSQASLHKSIQPAAAVCVAILLMAIFLRATIFAPIDSLLIDDRQLSYQQAALTIDADKDIPDGRLAAVEVGTLGFFSKRDILDFTGLTSFTPQYIDARHNDQFFESSPAAVVLHNPPLRTERAIAEDPRFPFWYDRTIHSGGAVVPLDIFVRTRLTEEELRDRIVSKVHGFEPLLMVNPISSDQAKCGIDFINGDGTRGRTTFRTYSKLLDIRGWAFREDLPVDHSERVRLILIGDAGRAFAIFAPRHDGKVFAKISENPEMQASGFSVVAHAYGIPRGRYGLMVWQQGALCGPAISLLLE